jgi:hypothetical protein
LVTTAAYSALVVAERKALALLQRRTREWGAKSQSFEAVDAAWKAWRDLALTLAGATAAPVRTPGT